MLSHQGLPFFLPLGQALPLLSPGGGLRYVNKGNRSSGCGQWKHKEGAHSPAEPPKEASERSLKDKRAFVSADTGAASQVEGTAEARAGGVACTGRCPARLQTTATWAASTRCFPSGPCRPSSGQISGGTPGRLLLTHRSPLAWRAPSSAMAGLDRGRRPSDAGQPNHIGYK